IRGLSPPVHTRCDGAAHGISAVVLACGQPGQRIVNVGCSISLTPLYSPTPGASVAELDRARRELVGILADVTGRREEEVSIDLTNGRSFDAATAVEYGLADQATK